MAVRQNKCEGGIPLNKQYIRNGLEYYMEVEPIGGEEYEYEMLKENKISNLLPLQIKQVNQKKYLLYSAAGVKPFWITIQKMWITGGQLYILVDSLLHALKELNRYFLSADNLVLERECLFLDLSRFQFHFLYVPGYQQDIFIQMEKLMEYLIGKIDYNEKEGAIFAYGLYRLLKEETTDLEEIQIYMEQNSPLFAAELEEKGFQLKSQEESNTQKSKMEISNTQMSKIEIPNTQKSKMEIPNTQISKPHLSKMQIPNIQISGVGASDKSIHTDNNPDTIPYHSAVRKNTFWKVLFFGIIWILLVVGIAVVLYLIYWYGILEWKRNCLIALAFFLSIDTVCILTQWKKKKQEEEAASVFETARNTDDFERSSINDEKEMYEDKEKMRYSEIQSARQLEAQQNQRILDGTILLTGNESAENIPRLISCKNENEILLTKFPFVIGSYHTGIDYRMEKKQISRFHACITKEQDIFMIEDLHSTNGTFINEKRLEGEEEQQIVSGDIIRFADLDYRFIE